MYIVLFKTWGKIFLRNKCIQQGCIELLKSDTEDTFNVTKDLK